MPDRKRKKQIEESIQRELGVLLLRNPRQPLFPKITITAVNVAPDLAVAKVFFSVFDGINVDRAKEALQNDTKFLRRSLAHDLNLRLTPRLNFVYDESIERGRHLSDLINTAIARDKSTHHES
ncbi:MAG: 30S ribosome-binding factor RbfA [Coxiellaceae bacterium]|jgi:ribosome-binding factor A|nr:30S ribosome-binding factor RbfA [Coxiellaceae bacterium]